MAWTADDLVAAVRRRSQLPDAAADGSVTDADLLEIANEELSLHLVPLVRASREDYWTTHEDFAVVAGTATYRVPSRAQASGLQDVCLVDSAGRERPLVRMDPGEQGRVQALGMGIDATVFVMEGPAVRLVPTPTVSGYTLRMRYHRAHSTLIPNINSGSLTLVSGELRVVSDPGNPAVAYHDIYYTQPPFGPVVVDFAPDSYNVDNYPTYTVFVVADPVALGFVTGVTYGVSPAGQTSVVDLPRECWPLLVSAVTSRVLEVIGDRDGAQMAIALYQRERENVAALLQPRVEHATMKMIDRDSPLRRGRRRWV